MPKPAISFVIRLAVKRCYALLLLLLSLAAAPIAARADDYGPPRAVGAVRNDARILLMRTARTVQTIPDPKISNVVVVGDQAIASWDTGSLHGVIGLEHYLNRWWEVLISTRQGPSGDMWSTQTEYPLHTLYDPDDCSPVSDVSLNKAGFSKSIAESAPAYNSDVVKIKRSLDQKHNLVVPGCVADRYITPPLIRAAGGVIQLPRQDEPLPPDYQVFLTYTKNDASAKALFAPTYMRAPTPAEMLPYPTPYYLSQNAVCFFDLGVDTSKPVAFTAGSTLEVWFPFVLDDKIRYDLTLAYAGIPIQPIYAKPFDNTLRFSLPAITISPSKPVMGEIDGGD